MRPYSKFSNSRRELNREVPIEDDELVAFAPAIFTRKPCDTRSSRYQHLTTLDIHQKMTMEGFRPYRVVQQIARKKDDSPEAYLAAVNRQQHMKHMVLYRHPDITTSNAIGHGGVGQVGLVNDSRGMTSVRGFAGWLEFLCANGLFIGDVAEAIAIRHTGDDLLNRVIEGMFRVMASIGKVAEWRGTLQSIPINREQSLEFAEEAIKLRWVAEAPIFGSQLLARHRAEDDITNLWGLYQVVEENMTKYTHIPYAVYERIDRASPEERKLLPRPNSVRPVTALDGHLSLERGLSDLAEHFRKSA
jgi:hypothetical protein